MPIAVGHDYSRIHKGYIREDLDPSKLYMGVYEGRSGFGPASGIWEVPGRLKGWVNRLINTEPLLDYLYSASAYFSEKLEKGKPTRLTFRTVVLDELLDGATATMRKVRRFIEAGVPIEIEGAQRPYHLVYFGANKIGRRVIPDEYKIYSENIRTAKDGGDNGLTERTSERMAHELGAGKREFNFPGKGESSKRFRTIIIDNTKMLKMNSIADINRLMKSFGYNEEDVATLINNPDNTLALTFLGEKVVGVTFAEQVSVDLDGKRKLNMIELTDAIVDMGERGNKIHYYASLFLTLALLHRAKAQDLRIDHVYGETNVDDIGALRTAHLQGRSFSTDTGHGRGLLEKHAVIDDDLKSFVVTWFPKEELDRFKALFA